MNYFFGIKNDKLRSKLTIPRFQNSTYTKHEYLIYQAEVENNKWKVNNLDNVELNEDFYMVDNDIVDNSKIFFLATKNEIKELERNNYLKLANLNNFTDTSPAFRANLQISLLDGGFSSYQSEYPYGMITKQGSILSSINSISNKSSDENIVFIKNIFELPIQEEFKVFFVNIKTKEILKKETVYTNYTNEIIVENHFIKPDVFLFTDKYLGVPMFVSINKQHISFEHTHPPHEYILSHDKFKKVSELKREISEIIY